MPDTWDGTGPTPTGWAKTAVDLHVGTSNTALDIPDAFAVLLQGAPAQANMTGPERAAVAQAIAQRVQLTSADYTSGGYVPKARAADEAAEKKER